MSRRVTKIFCFYHFYSIAEYSKSKFYISSITQKQLFDKNKLEKNFFILNQVNDKTFIKTISKNLFSIQNLSISNMHSFWFFLSCTDTHVKMFIMQRDGILLARYLWGPSDKMILNSQSIIKPYSATLNGVSSTFWGTANRFLSVFFNNRAVKSTFSNSAVIFRFLLAFNKKFFLRKSNKIDNFALSRIARVNFFKTSILNKTSKVKEKKSFSLVRRVFINNARINEFFWASLFKTAREGVVPHKIRFLRQRLASKLRKKRNRLLLFLNINKPIISKLRKARYAHWSIRTRGKLNEYRYNKLIAFELKQTPLMDATQVLYYYLLATYSVVLSWKQILRLLLTNLILVNGQPVNATKRLNKGDIVELPHNTAIMKRRRVFGMFLDNIVRRAKYTNYKSFINKRERFKKLAQPHAVPKIFKRLPISTFSISQYFFFYPALGALFVLKKLPHHQFNIENSLFTTSVLSLHNWRYRFD